MSMATFLPPQQSRVFCLLEPKKCLLSCPLYKKFAGPYYDHGNGGVISRFLLPKNISGRNKFIIRCELDSPLSYYLVYLIRKSDFFCEQFEFNHHGGIFMLSPEVTLFKLFHIQSFFTDYKTVFLEMTLKNCYKSEMEIFIHVFPRH